MFSVPTNEIISLRQQYLHLAATVDEIRYLGLNYSLTQPKLFAKPANFIFNPLRQRSVNIAVPAK